MEKNPIKKGVRQESLIPKAVCNVTGEKSPQVPILEPLQAKHQ